MVEPTYDWGASVGISDQELIPDYLMGKDELMEATPEATVRFNSVLICRIVGGKLDAIACDHPRHGSHPRLRESYEKLNRILSKLKVERVDGPCPKCGGEGWLKTNTAEARHVVLLSLTFGMWRGVAFTPRGLQPGSAADTMGTLLTGQAPVGASSGPGGMAAPARANLQGQGKGEGNGQGKGE